MHSRTGLRVVSLRRRWRGRALPFAPPLERGPRSIWDPVRHPSRIRGYGLLDQFECSGFVTKTHIGQREIVHQERIFRLFIEKRLQFAARLSPTLLGGGMVTGDLLRSA